MKPPLAKALIVLVLAAAIIGLTMSAAIRRSMDHAVTTAAGDHTAIAIALSQSIYHVNLGYLGLKQVADTIYEYWTGESRGEEPNVTFPNSERLNAGVRAAASLGPQTPGYVSDGSLIVTQDDGKGAVDYVTIAFKLFGIQVESLFYLHFALIGLSAVVFILTFRDNICALAVLLCTLAAYYIQLRVRIFDPAAVPTYFGMRSASTVCLVAMWHFVFLVVLARKPTPWVLLGAVVQLAVVILAWRLRWAAIWVVGFVILVALVPALRHLHLRQFSLLWPPLQAGYATIAWRSTVTAAASLLAVAQAASRWPIILLLAGLLASSLYDRASLHAVYFTDDVMAERGLWKPAYLGVTTYDPGVLDPRVSNAVKALGVSDELSWWAARDYMDRIRLVPWDGKLDFSRRAPNWMSEWGQIGIRAGLQDRMLRGGFMEAVKKHPIRVLIIYLARKPVDILSTLITPFTRGVTWLVLSLFIGVGIGAFIMRFGREEDARAQPGIILVGGGAVLAATTPSLWAYPQLPAMGDTVVLLVAFALIAIAMATAATLTRRRAAAGKRSEPIGRRREAKEGTMRAVMAPLYRLAEHTKGYALAQWVSRPTTDRFRALIDSRVNPRLDERLLDVGCGPGHYRSSFTCEYSGIDINPDYIRMASSRLDGRFMVMDGTRLAFEDESFDHVVSVAILHHLADEQVVQMVREARRVCKPSGRVHLLDAILPVTPNFTFKRIIFQLDRGEYPRTHEHLCALIAKAGPISAREIMPGPLHDVTYVGVTPGA
jgi:SAM-dependent methyltransferase